MGMTMCAARVGVSEPVSRAVSQLSLGPWLDEVRIVLLGSTGVGKSETGCTILGNQRAFKFDSTFCSITKTCSRKSAQMFGTEFHVTDTPGIIDTSSGDSLPRVDEVMKCLEVNMPGPHVFLYILRADTRLTAEDVEALKSVEKYFGEEIFTHMIIVFTRGDALYNTARSIDDILEEMPTEFVQLYQKCDKRCVSIENMGSGTSAWDMQEKGPKVESNRRDLFQTIHRLLSENNWSCYPADRRRTNM